MRKMRIPKPTMTIILIVIIVFGGTLAVSGAYYIARGDIYNGGWESQNGLHDIVINGQSFDPLGTKPDGSLSWGPAYCKVDADGSDSKTGVPDVVVSITSPREYVLSGADWVVAQSGQVFDSINKKVTIGDITYNYFWDHHVLFFEVKMVAIADAYAVLGYAHGEAKGMFYAEPAEIAVKTSFQVDPWVNKIVDSFSTDTGDYILDADTVWSGVMSCSVAAIEAGYVGHLSDPTFKPTNPGLVVADNTGKLNMWTVDGASASGDTFPSEPHKDALPGVPEKVIFEVSTELSPGWEWPWFGTIGTYAVSTNYKIRVDVLTSAGYQLEDGEQEDEHLNDTIIDDPADPFGDWLRGAGEFWDGVFTSLGAFAVGFILPIVIVIAVAVILFFIMRIVALRKGKPF